MERSFPLGFGYQIEGRSIQICCELKKTIADRFTYEKFDNNEYSHSLP